MTPKEKENRLWLALEEILAILRKMGAKNDKKKQQDK